MWVKAIISWWQKEIFFSYQLPFKGSRKWFHLSFSWSQSLIWNPVDIIWIWNVPPPPSAIFSLICLLVVLISAQIVSESDHKLYIVKPIRIRCFFIEFCSIKIILINVSPSSPTRRPIFKNHCVVLPFLRHSQTTPRPVPALCAN